MRPFYRPHYTFCSSVWPSVRPSVPYGLVTRKQKNVEKSKFVPQSWQNGVWCAHKMVVFLCSRRRDVIGIFHWRGLWSNSSTPEEPKIEGGGAWCLWRMRRGLLRQLGALHGSSVSSFSGVPDGFPLFSALRKASPDTIALLILDHENLLILLSLKSIVMRLTTFSLTDVFNYSRRNSQLASLCATFMSFITKCN